MRIVYRQRSSRRQDISPIDEGDVLELLENDWNDYGYETTFNTACRVAGEVLDLGSIKILFEGKTSSRGGLRDLAAGDWDGSFPLVGQSYISVPTEITFYQQLVSLLGEQQASEVALALRDASYLVNLRNDAEAVRMSKAPGFETSLQRERGAQNAFLDGWKVFTDQTAIANNLDFRFLDANGDSQTISFRFQTESLLPHDINVLIGPNGVGKSQLLHQLVRDWIDDADDKAEGAPGFISRPSLSQIVVLSYSPFERFPVTMGREDLQDNDAYKYFGLRGQSAGQGEPVADDLLSLEVPKMASARSLLSCIADDQRFRSVREWAKKLATVEDVLRTAFPFDFAAVEVERSPRPIFSRGNPFRPSPLFDGPAGEQFVRIESAGQELLLSDSITEKLKPERGVVFFKDGAPLELSSGQRLFSYIVINLLGVMRRNSLILIDEPELFLHPTLEIQLVDMLKEILKQFNSKALFATHSIVTVREIPADCVHVFARTDDGIAVQNPPFQTFGGDVQRITSYVFGDRAVSKPFESWIKDQLRDHSAADLINLLRDELNEEMIIQIAAMGRVV
ncbi:ATP-binding protein [Rhizobium leguminosarum bv. viciae]|uniref:AAA family ATPase n=1 Tax=Rhizobium leguminosarum TaxID=384 RepID=UPI001040AB10|nr:AAA family ATPase [Rhizobium leguminosarum]TCA18486.1 ATP-binding protein [Rhizobium leguminosarum bv. viciae]